MHIQDVQADPAYEVPLDRKRLALDKRAREIGIRELAAMVYLARVRQPICNPETAIARMRALRRQRMR